jgi:hypothetical protein
MRGLTVRLGAVAVPIDRLQVVRVIGAASCRWDDVIDLMRGQRDESRPVVVALT